MVLITGMLNYLIFASIEILQENIPVIDCNQVEIVPNDEDDPLPDLGQATQEDSCPAGPLQSLDQVLNRVLTEPSHNSATNLREPLS